MPIIFPLLEGARGGMANQSRPRGMAPRRAKMGIPRFPSMTISGVTRDSAGVPLAACRVELFRSSDDVKVGETTSDGGGNYTFRVGLGQQYYAIAYQGGSPDLAGTTVNTMEGVRD
jgi:hypothetical protein